MIVIMNFTRSSDHIYTFFRFSLSNQKLVRGQEIIKCLDFVESVPATVIRHIL